MKMRIPDFLRGKPETFHLNVESYRVIWIMKQQKKGNPRN